MEGERESKKEGKKRCLFISGTRKYGFYETVKERGGKKGINKAMIERKR